MGFLQRSNDLILFHSPQGPLTLAVVRTAQEMVFGAVNDQKLLMASVALE
jgi:hypothetical protein